MNKEKYYSNISFFTIFLVIIAVFILYIPNIFIFNYFNYIYFIIATIILLFIILTIFSTHYIIQNNKLYMYALFIKFEVDINRIKSISKVKNIKLSFATSVTRLEIDFSYHKKSKWTVFYVSPKNETSFIQTLKRINPNIIYINGGNNENL